MIEKLKESVFSSTVLKIILTVFVGIFVSWFLYQNPLLDKLISASELKASDLLINSVDSKAASDIVIVTYDNPSLSVLGKKYGRWPYPREVTAKLFRYFDYAEVRLALIDLLFIGEQPGQLESDKELVNSFLDSKRVVISMNFDNDQFTDDMAGQGLTLQDLINLEAFSIPLQTGIDPSNPNVQVGKDGFFDNPYMTFNNYSPILPDLLAEKNRVAFINMSISDDGVIRSVPLFLRFSRLLDSPSSPTGQIQLLQYFPSLPLKGYLMLKYPDQLPSLSLTPSGDFQVGNDVIPLDKFGNIIVNWHDYNVRADEILKHDPNAEIKPMPYEYISAWRVIDAFDRYKSGNPTEEDIALKNKLANKIVFVGITSDTLFDVKTSPLGNLPGVEIHATVLDNLLHPEQLIHPVDQWLQFIVLLLIAVGMVLTLLKSRQVSFEILSAVGGVSIYIAIVYGSFVLFNHVFQIVMPVLVLSTAAVVVLVYKYFLSSRAYEVAYSQAHQDSLTGLNNNRYYQKYTQQALELSQRQYLKFSMILIDIDHFKNFNDTYGHLIGDEVLRLVAQKLKSTVRTSDMVARYGGEEMIIVLKETDYDIALTVAEKVREAIAAETYKVGEEGKTEVSITISAGVCTYPEHGGTVQELYEYCDKYLYVAKEAGRNCVGNLKEDN